MKASELLNEVSKLKKCVLKDLTNEAHQKLIITPDLLEAYNGSIYGKVQSGINNITGNIDYFLFTNVLTAMQDEDVILEQKDSKLFLKTKTKKCVATFAMQDNSNLFQPNFQSLMKEKVRYNLPYSIVMLANLVFDKAKSSVIETYQKLYVNEGKAIATNGKEFLVYKDSLEKQTAIYYTVLDLMDASSELYLSDNLANVKGDGVEYFTAMPAFSQKEMETILQAKQNLLEIITKNSFQFPFPPDISNVLFRISSMNNDVANIILDNGVFSIKSVNNGGNICEKRIVKSKKKATFSVQISLLSKLVKLSAEQKIPIMYSRDDAIALLYINTSNFFYAIAVDF